MTTHYNIWQIALTIYISGCTVAAILTLTWVGVCYLTPLMKCFYYWLESIDSRVKGLSERLKSNDTPTDSKPKDIQARMQDIKNKLIAQNILLLEAKENLEKANKRMKSC